MLIIFTVQLVGMMIEIVTLSNSSCMYILNLCYIPYVVWNFYSGYYEDNKVKLSLSAIALKYAKSYLLFDTVPLVANLLTLYFVRETFNSSYKLFNLLQFVRIRTFFTYISDICIWRGIPKYVEVAVKGGLVFSIFVFWLTVILYTFINLHPHSWINAKYFHSDSYRVTSCISSALMLLMFVDRAYDVDITHIGLFLHVFGLFLGFILQVFILIILLKVMQTATSSYNHYQRMIGEINEYMKVKGIPVSLKKQIFHYIDFRFHGHFHKEKTIETILTPTLNREIKEIFVSNLMQNVTFLHLLPDNVRSNIVEKLQVIFYFPNDIVIRFGDDSNLHMYFIYLGTVALYDAEGNELCHLEEGSNFGELGAISDKPRTATVVAITPCKMYRLTREDFLWSLRNNPEVKRELRLFANIRIPSVYQI